MIKKYKNKIPSNATMVYKGKIFEVHQWPQILFDGSVETFEMIKRPDTVIVVAIVGDELVVLNDEQPHRSSKLSFPGGHVDSEDEPWLDAAKREVREETGYAFREWRQVMIVEDQPKVQHASIYFVAYDVESRVEQKLDAGERITVYLKNFIDTKNAVTTQKDQYIHYAKPIFDRVDSIEALRNLQAFEV